MQHSNESGGPPIAGRASRPTTCSASRRLLLTRPMQGCTGRHLQTCTSSAVRLLGAIDHSTKAQGITGPTRDSESGCSTAAASAHGIAGLADRGNAPHAGSRTWGSGEAKELSPTDLHALGSGAGYVSASYISCPVPFLLILFPSSLFCHPSSL